MTTEPMKPQPVLYILMRTDLDSLNPGKGMAQAAHAANQFQTVIQSHSDKIKALYEQWSKESNGGGFGTTIVLDAKNHVLIQEFAETARRKGFLAGVVTDDTYPIQDGEVVWTLPVITCGFIFGDKNDSKLRDLLDILELHY